MSALFGKKITKEELQEQTKKQKDTVQSAVREIDREIMRIQNENGMLYFKIQDALKKNQREVLRVLAKQKLRNQAAISRFEIQKANLSCLKIKMMELMAMQIMTGAIVASDNVMTQMMNQCDVRQISKQLQSFEKNMDKMSQRQEQMDEMMDDVFATANEDMGIEQMVDEEVNRLVDEFQMRDFSQAGVQNLDVQAVQGGRQ